MGSVDGRILKHFVCHSYFSSGIDAMDCQREESDLVIPRSDILGGETVASCDSLSGLPPGVAPSPQAFPEPSARPESLSPQTDSAFRGTGPIDGQRMIDP
jgi:hypothetical protein